MLEQPLPELSADRLDYNIQGAYFQQFLTLKEARQLFCDLVYKKGRWILPNRDLALKLARFSLYMTETCWGSALNSLTSRWLADAIIQGCETGAISWQEFHFGIDQEIWDRLSASKDPLIQERMQMLSCPIRYFRFVSPPQAKLIIPFKCRGIDPWVKEGDKIERLSSMDSAFREAFQKTKKQSLEGWSVEQLNQ